MFDPLRLGYLVFGVSRLPRWQAFCSAMLGLPAPASNEDGSLGWRIDDASQCLIACADDADDLLAVGIDCIDAAGLERRVKRLERCGVAVAEAAEPLRRARRVAALFIARDPAGNTVELHFGAERARDGFASVEFPGGFVTGDLGIGHAALIARDLDAMEAFWVDQLGFAATERLDTRVGPLHVRGTFLHCNRRHHSIALFDIPSRKRLHHFMLEAGEHMDVGRAFERTRAAKVPLSLDIGQHPDPDGTFSFYGTTPAGFDFEIGTGSKVIEPQGWRLQQTSTASSWGHTPQLRLKLRTVKELLSDKIRAAAGAR